MSKIYNCITEITGNTPLIELNNIEKKYDLHARIAAKLEFLNPAGSVKDRIAIAMIEHAEAMGILKKDSCIIEPTSGNTGIGLAAIAAAKGYKIIITMPDTMSKERASILRAYGAEVVLTDGKEGMRGAILKAREIAEKTPNSFIPGQFSNPINPECHRQTTGPEIWNDTDGEIDMLVAGVGTGGTISGAGEYLKCQNENIKLIAVEPSESPVLSMCLSGKHAIEGIGPGFVPDTLNTEIYDEIFDVSDSEAVEAAKNLAANTGIFAGISSGAALHAAISIAKRKESEGKLIVVIFPDGGERYLSTGLFD